MVELTRRSVLREALLLLWRESTPYVRVRLLVALLLVIFASGMTAVTPVAFKLAIDALAVNGAASAYASPIALIVLYALALYLVRVAGELRMFTHGTAEQRLHRHLSTTTNAHGFSLPLHYHWSQPAGTVEKTLDQGLRGCESIMRQALYTLLPVAVELATVCIVLLHFGQPLYLAIFAASAVAYGAIYWIGARRSGAAAKEVSTARIETGALLNDGLLNVETLKAFGAVPWFLGLYGERLDRTEQHWRAFYQRRIATGQLAALVFGASVLAALLVTVRGVTQGSATVGDLVLINAYLFRLTAPLEQLGFAARELSQGMAFLERLLTLLREVPEADALPSTRRLEGGGIRFHGVSFMYPGTPEPVLCGVSFAVPSGSTVAIVGSNGAGKSTLGRLLLRAHEPDAGQIDIGGVSLADIPRDELRRTIVTIPQDTVLLHTTIRDNITLGAAVSDADLSRVLRLAQLDRFIAELPEGLETVVGHRGLRLSGGQRQCVAIARALLKEASIILCDEATSSLDPRTEQELLPALMQMAQRQTTIFITHRLTLAASADSILVLDSGRIIEEGTHAELIAHGGHYAQLWQAAQRSQEGFAGAVCGLAASGEGIARQASRP